MKKLLSIFCLSYITLFAAECNVELTKIDNQITKAKSAKKINQEKLRYLNSLKERIQSNCNNGLIDNTSLRQIKEEEKHSYEMQKITKAKDKLKAQEAKLEEKERKIKQKHQDNINKINAKKDKKNK